MQSCNNATRLSYNPKSMKKVVIYVIIRQFLLLVLLLAGQIPSAKKLKFVGEKEREKECRHFDWIKEFIPNNHLNFASYRPKPTFKN